MGKKYKRKSGWSLPKDGYLGAAIRMLPAMLMVGIVPLIVKAYRYETNLTQYAWFDETKISYEFFLASKAVALMLLFFVMAGAIGVRLWKEKKKLPFIKLFVPLFAYGLLTFLSACFSVNTNFSFMGGQDQFETVWALLSYVTVVYYVFLYATEESELRVVADGLCFGSIVIGILGTLQGLGFDYLANGFVQKLITNKRFWASVSGELSLNFSDGQALATLYNPNYLGVYGSFVIPFLAILIWFETSKWRRVWHGVNFVLLTVAMLFSRSRAGFFAVIIALGVAVVLCVRGMIKYWYLTVPAINLAVAIVLLVNAYNDNLLFERLQGIFGRDEVTVTEEIAEDGTLIRKTGLTELYTEENGVWMTYNEVKLCIEIYRDDTYYGYYALLENGEQTGLEKKEAEEVFFFTHPALAGITLTPFFVEDTPGFTLKAEGDWSFWYNTETKKYQYVTAYEGANNTIVYKESDMIMAESFLFEGRQTMFSNRGYIWSRSIPLLKENIILGSGPDTFILEYPQNDYLMMAKNGFSRQFMTKPHSMYLQIGVQTGVLSLLCLLVFWGWYGVWSLRLYSFRKLTTLAEGFGIASFIGSIGYLISGISNDSMVVTAPVFWGMMGLGVAANAWVASYRKKAEAGVAVSENKK